MKFLSHKYSFFIITLCVLVVCIILIIFRSGFNHEWMKIMSILVHVFLVTLALFLISDLVKFLVLGIDTATWPKQEVEIRVEQKLTTHTRTDYLKMRLNILRSQLLVTEDHLDENLNLRYQLIAIDLWLYGTYFLLLTCLVLVTQDSLLYYNTVTMQKLFTKNQTLSLGLNYVLDFEMSYLFIESALVNSFNPNPNETAYQSWVYGDSSAKIGVVRLRQLRVKENYHLGWYTPQFSNLDYMPRWQLPYNRVPYTDKYWHIYEPWLSATDSYNAFEKFFLNFKHEGYFQEYPEYEGYITLLARTRRNSKMILDYLQKHNWISRQTAAVFLDFTLYNADSNIFTIFTLLLEQTPFGTIFSRANVASVKIQILYELGTLGFVVAIIYMLALIQFAKTLVVTVWFEPSKMRKMWNKVDLVILILNVLVVVCIVLQETMVSTLLEKVEHASKLEFLDFRRPARVQYITNIIVGFLVCLTTLRLWKVLQFANVFKLFSAALYAAWQALASTALIILIFLSAFGIAVAIINGNNTKNFNHIIRSIITSLCFSFGFNSHVTPQDLFYGGVALGLILYLMLAFILAQLLINVFVSTINGYFASAKAIRDANTVRRINFLQFLRVEYASFFNLFQKLPCFSHSYHRKNRTVAENIKITLDQQQRSGTKNRYRALSTEQTEQMELDENKKQMEYRRRIGRLYTVASIMQTQIQLLEHLFFREGEDLFEFKADDKNDEDDEYLV